MLSTADVLKCSEMTPMTPFECECIIRQISQRGLTVYGAYSEPKIGFQRVMEKGIRREDHDALEVYYCITAKCSMMQCNIAVPHQFERHLP